MRPALLLITILFSIQSFAAIQLRVPILFHTSTGHKVYNVADLKKQLAGKNLNLPDYIYLSDTDTAELDRISQQIEEANIKVKGISVYMERYGRISTYQGKNIKFPLCYYKSRGRGMDLKANARTAYRLITNLTGNLLSDQYTILGVRFYDEEFFTNEHNGDEEEAKKFFKPYEKKKLKIGDIQIVATTNDSGDDDASDILPLCR